MQAKLKYDYKDYNSIVEEQNKKGKIVIQVYNREVGCVYIWDTYKFSNRYYIIKDMLDKFFDSNEIPVSYFYFIIIIVVQKRDIYYGTSANIHPPL
jgi:hypothetical protein